MLTQDDFKQWALGFSGCDGGDIGSKKSPSIWVCGYEWGGGHDEASLSKSIRDKDHENIYYYEYWKDNVVYKFNRQIMKLLAVIHDYELDDYKKFAEEVSPFVKNSPGFFKMNLFPIAFKDADINNWSDFHTSITGFKNKNEYLEWCRQYRLPKIRDWASTFCPKYIICVGNSYIYEYHKAFGDSISEFKEEIIEGSKLRWLINKDKTHVINIPFMTSARGLKSHNAINKFGLRIKEILN